MWQDTAFQEWRAQLRKNRDSNLLRLLDGLSPTDEIRWLLRAERPVHPVASGMAHWLSSMADQNWRVVPSDDWELCETSEMVLYAYPEYLGSDPLAMCAMAVGWAGTDHRRWRTVVNRLGPVTLLAAWSGKWATPAAKAHFSSYLSHYQSYRDAWKLHPMAQEWGMTFEGHDQRGLAWPQVPEYGMYREQLAFGVVPHQINGDGIDSEVAVLLALHEVPDAERKMMAGLSFKALEGRWLIDAWQKAR